MKRAKDKTKDKTKKEPKEKTERKAKKRTDKPKGVRVMMSIKDIVAHKKKDRRTLSAFGQWKPGETKLGDTTLNFNSLDPDGLAILADLLGVNSLELETPLIMDLYVPVGALLTDYNETVQTRLDGEGDGDGE